jgi:hypothetical protein
MTNVDKKLASSDTTRVKVGHGLPSARLDGAELNGFGHEQTPVSRTMGIMDREQPD